MVTNAAVYFPLAVVGLWRWSVWTVKVLLAQLYEPYDGPAPDLSVSVVVPVYQADPDDFMDTVDTWLGNNPHELIAVIDHGDTEIIERFQAVADEHSHVSCIVTSTPGKRPALQDGVAVAEGEIIALVDDDVKWRENTLEEFLKPFTDPDIGAVSPKQVVQDQSSISQKLYEVQMRLQFAIDYPALSAVSKSLSCISGRTAVYRREALLPIIDDLTEETFLGKEVISGDDKFLTRAVQANDWDVVYQSTSVIDIGAVPIPGEFISQTVRWTRNTIRSDIKAMAEGWVFRRKALAYYNVDRFISMFAILLAPVYFSVALSRTAYIIAGAILIWWTISRSVKMYPYLRLHPRNAWLVPLYTLGAFIMSPLYLYALFSANTQGWLTRGDDSRFGFNQLRQRLVTSSSVMLVVLTLTGYIGLLLQFRY